MNSYLTQEEIGRLQTCDLSRETPFIIRGVTNTQLSIARHHGGCKFNGQYYEYIDDTDELIRSDVRHMVHKWRNPKKSKKPKQPAPDLFQPGDDPNN